MGVVVGGAEKGQVEVVRSLVLTDPCAFGCFREKWKSVATFQGSLWGLKKKV